jgi:hypothetical protein
MNKINVERDMNTLILAGGLIAINKYTSNINEFLRGGQARTLLNL